MLIFIIFACRYNLWFLGGFVLASPPILGYATTWNEGYMPAVPALQSYWIKIHVPLVMRVRRVHGRVRRLVLYLLRYYGEQLIGTAAAVRSRAGRRRRRGASGRRLEATMRLATAVDQLRRNAAIATAAARGDTLALWLAELPSLAKLDILTYRIVAVGLPLLTVGIITGAWWAKEAWGAYWQWDPKRPPRWSPGSSTRRTCICTRATRGAAAQRVGEPLGFATIVFCYLGVNIWISGLHSLQDVDAGLRRRFKAGGAIDSGDLRAEIACASSGVTRPRRIRLGTPRFAGSPRRKIR